MSGKTKIEWSEFTWNPIVGCSVVSPGCTNCYAMKFAGNRLDGNPKTPHYAGTTQKSKAGPVWTGKMGLASEKTLQQPLHWMRPRMIFVNSMGDLFHESVPDEWIDQVFAVMALAPQHTFQVLTKRAERMRAYVASLKESGRWLLWKHPIQGHDIFCPMYAQFHSMFVHVWLGVSAEDQQRADERIPHLLATPAAVRFVSAEPLLEQICFDLSQRTNASGTKRGIVGGGVDLGTIDWIIAGGESGPGARPMHPDWVRSIRDQCQAAGVPFFFKQWGEWAPGALNANWSAVPNDGDLKIDDPNFDLAQVTRIGKKAAGRLLDGREWLEMPEAGQ